MLLGENALVYYLYPVVVAGYLFRKMSEFCKHETNIEKECRLIPSIMSGNHLWILHDVQELPSLRHDF
jgi:hypothetical protein